MNIQISVVIWTVICFLLLMLILKNLLFTPVLRLMDNRKKRIEAADEKQKESERIISENIENLKLRKEELLNEQCAMLKKEEEKARKAAKSAVEKANSERFSETETYRESLEKERIQILESIKLSSGEIAKAFAENIISQ